MKSFKAFCKENRIKDKEVYTLLVKNAVSEKDLVFFDAFDFDIDLHNRKGIDEMNRYIKSNQNIYLPKYTLLFHSTGFNLKSFIDEDGLLPTSKNRRRSYQSTDGFVYLALTRAMAEMFGSLGNGSKIVTYLVLLKTTELSIDTDQLRNKRAVLPNVEIKQTLADSIVFGNTVRHKGKIEPYKIISLSE